MKNLVYYICNDEYRDVLYYNLSLLQKHNNIDTCCIAPRSFTPQNNNQLTHIHYVDNFDYRYTAKFLIHEWEKINEYENILYIDVDAIPNKSLDNIFKLINEQKDVIHGVIEKESLQFSDLYHKFSVHTYETHIPAFNAGTFGFNKQMIPIFTPLLRFIKMFKNKALLDQSLFNEFFCTKGIIQPTLSKFTYLYNIDNIYENINQVSLQDATIVHFLGNAYNGKSVQKIKTALNNL